MSFNQAATGMNPPDDNRCVVVCNLDRALIGQRAKLSSERDLIGKSVSPDTESAIRLKYNFDLLQTLSDFSQNGARVIIAGGVMSLGFLEFCQQSLLVMQGFAKKMGYTINVSKFEFARARDILDLKDENGQPIAIDVSFIGDRDPSYDSESLLVRVSQDQTSPGKFTTSPPLDIIRRICIISEPPPVQVAQLSMNGPHPRACYPCFSLTV